MMGSFLKKEFKPDEDPNLISVSEFIKNRLYFATYKNKIPRETKKIHYFTANDDYTSDENSEPISRLSLGTISQFIRTLNIKLSHKKKHAEKVIVNYSTGSERKRSNAAVLIGVYAITHLDMSTEEVAEKLSQHAKISPLDALTAVQKAINLKFINFHTFNSEDFYSLDDVKLNWVVPNKFLMFAGPIETSNGRYLSPRRYIEYFHHVRVQTIIRLCHIKYDANPFVDANISHYDLNIAGSVPSDKVLEVFLHLSEECEGVVLVHCREFLGRAGCLVGAYLVKHFGMEGGEAMAWLRMCTSECILEAQKTWLKNNEAALQKTGEEFRLKKSKGVQLARGICERGTQARENEILEEQSNQESSSVEDVTAQFENEIRVVDIVKSDSDLKEQIENAA